MHTKKIGHTGTLDTFADGLLVALAGRLTRLVSYITDCDKEYLAEITFGTETDTLDPEGKVVLTSPLPRLDNLLASLASFRGNIQQQPPVYSAVHVSGQRSSDRVRNGQTVELPFRRITIHSIEVLETRTADGILPKTDSPIHSMKLRIVCSKGTYIRSLARDIAHSCASCGHLSALRRTRIGPFKLEDAAGVSLLAPFGSVLPAAYGIGDRPPQASSEEITKTMQVFTATMAPVIGLNPLFLESSCSEGFLNGKSPMHDWFSGFRKTHDYNANSAVFCGERFFGVISFIDRKPVYEFVAGRDV